VTDAAEIFFGGMWKSSVENDVEVTAVRWHGRFIKQTAGEVKNIVKAMILRGGAILNLSNLWLNVSD
jgi:hypothetical protein